MSAFTYVKSAISHWFVHRNEPMRKFYFNTLRPLYMKSAARRERRQWKRMKLTMLSENEVRTLIRESLVTKRPFTAAKIGATEFFMLRWWAGEKVILSRVYDLYKLSGVFPRDLQFFRRYAEVYAASLKSLDLLGLWTGKDEPAVYRTLGLTSSITNHESFSGNFGRIALGGDPGWFPEIKGYRVMVISSFADLINRRANEADWDLYWGPRFPWPKPEWIKAVPFPYGFETKTQERYGDSLELLRQFKEEHQALMENCDLVLAGCGAYAVPLLDWAREHGKVAIHMGGDIQLLFGIKGGRWDTLEGLYNEHWVRPGATLTPTAAEDVENSCYW